jgi:hypothetical protein
VLVYQDSHIREGDTKDPKTIWEKLQEEGISLDGVPTAVNGFVPWNHRLSWDIDTKAVPAGFDAVDLPPDAPKVKLHGRQSCSHQHRGAQQHSWTRGHCILLPGKQPSAAPVRSV